ncbi:MAG: hypothetical protein JSR24_00455 [Proteobacteria bacterium]|nr:hypothetical protein [Pseudomonadota bacterium]
MRVWKNGPNEVRHCLCSRALAEIAGCFAFWSWLRLAASIWWLGPGVAALIFFAFLVTLVATVDELTRLMGGVYTVAPLFKLTGGHEAPSNHRSPIVW